jgi:nucleoside phosphorylase
MPTPPTYSRPQDRNAFEVAIICALSVEAEAMITLFDDFWECDDQYAKVDGDTNSYTIGRLGQHHVVLVHMSHIGKVPGANAATSLRSSFPRIRLGLLVGICGGVPFVDGGKGEIILGDIVISTQIVQADFGRQYSDNFVRKNTPQDNLPRPCPEIGSFLTSLQNRAAQIKLENHVRTNLVTIFDAEDFKISKYPGIREDKLFESTYRHKHQNLTACTICANCVNPEDSVCVDALNLSCAELGCESDQLVFRTRIQKAIDDGRSDSFCNPMIHFGKVASGDQVIRSAQHRDRVAEQENVIAFEMEGAGLWETIPTIVVKGVCDYADSHKNKRWQLYAAATAAACTKGLLQAWRPRTTPARNGRHDGAALLPPARQVFNGSFTAGKNIHNGGSYTADSISF